MLLSSSFRAPAGPCPGMRSLLLRTSKVKASTVQPRRVQVQCCAAPAPSGPPPDGSHNRLQLGLSRDLPATTAMSAYAKAVSLPQTVRDSGLVPAVASPKPPAQAASHLRTPVAKTAGQQQAVQHVLHNETAYTFMAPNWEPLIGRSRQHQRVEKEVLKAAATTKPLLVSGDVGLKTLRMAATVHALGLQDEDVSHPVVVVDCSSASGAAAASQLLLGWPDGLLQGVDHTKSSVDVAQDALLLSALTDGTLVLSNVHKAPCRLLALADAAVAALMPGSVAAAAAAAVMARLTPAFTEAAAASGSEAAAGAPGAESAASATVAELPGSFLLAHRTRLVLVSQLPLAQLLEQIPPTALLAGAAVGQLGPVGPGLRDCPAIALPALRARPSDIGPLAVAAGRSTAALRGYQGIQLTDAAEMQLTSYDFPGNEAELLGLVQRAVMLHPPAPTAAGASIYGSMDSALCSCDGGCVSGTSSSCDGTGMGACDSVGACGTAAASGPVLTLDAGDFWAATGDADRGRVDVLEVLPWLRRYILDTGMWPVGLNRITRVLFPLILASLFLGPQDRESSAALTVFWAGWWPLVMLSFPFVGRAWCAMCPFMITGEVAQDLLDSDTPANSSSTSISNSTTGKAPAHAAGGAASGAAASTAAVDPATAGAQGQGQGVLGLTAAAVSAAGRKLSKVSGVASDAVGWQLHKWPTEAIERWAGWFVIAAFAGILMWEQVWDLPGHAALSGWLLVLITSGAVACSIVWEKRLWCRYLCPIGAMNGLFAKLSMTEIRSRPGLCAAAACTKPCHKGRIDHVTEEVPCSNPGDSTFPGPSWLFSLLPWANTNSTASCSQAGSECSGSLTGAAQQGSLGCCSSSSCASGSTVGSDGAAMGACSAFIDASAVGLDTHAFGQSCSSCGSLVSPAGAAGFATYAPGVVTVQHAVVLPGCPINGYPGKNKDNQQCIMCGNCLRSCTSGSAQWRLRPPAADLWGDHQASWTEVHLMNVLLGSVLLHRLPQVCAQLGLPADQIMSDKGPHLLLCAALLAAPSAATWLFHAAATAAGHSMADRTAAARKGPAGVLTGAGSGADMAEEDSDGLSSLGQVSFLRMSYSVLPLVWAGILAQYEDLLLTELGQIAPRLALSLGVTPDTPWLSLLPTLGPAPAAVVSAAQGMTLFLCAGLSLALAGKIGSVEVQHGRATVEEVERAVLPQRLLTLLVSAELWHIIL